ncbi:DciA family protein [Sinomicrobium sp.]
MAKRHSEHISLSEGLKAFIAENKLQSGMDKIDVRKAWKQLMGSGIANYTSDIQLKNDTLYVSLTSSVLREELSYGKEKIIAIINEELGKELIKKIVLR